MDDSAPAILPNEKTIRGGVHAELSHDSAAKHVTGQADYTDDIPEPVGTLHACLGLSDIAHAEIKSMELGAEAASPRSNFNGALT